MIPAGAEVEEIELGMDEHVLYLTAFDVCRSSQRILSEKLKKNKIFDDALKNGKQQVILEG